ncbi:hypothetical protein [Modestobacter marinus]|nr:hypothetical protein [Modestobacter marinus]
MGHSGTGPGKGARARVVGAVSTIRRNPLTRTLLGAGSSLADD